MAEVRGGYDEGYSAVPCLWGLSPGSLVADLLSKTAVQGYHVLDIGAGEGKNAAAFAERGARVDAVECSRYAVANGKAAFSNLSINWITTNALDYRYENEAYDVVVSYGLTHCMKSEEDARRLIALSMRSVKRGGVYVLVSFNNGSHDLSAHPGFEPLLLPHSWFEQAFSDWQIQVCTDTILHETHPHNMIAHHHSLTRLVAGRP